MTVEQRCQLLRKMIEASCVECQLNLAVRDGKICFIDQSQMKIVAIWEPKFKISAPDNVIQLSDYQKRT